MSQQFGRMLTSSTNRSLTELIRSGMTIAWADGVGTPLTVAEELSNAVRQQSDVTLLLGWMPIAPDGLDLTAFARVVTLMGGYSLRRPIDEGQVQQLPVRMGAVPALLGRAMRPDLVVLAARRDDSGFSLTTEVSWLRSALLTGAQIAVVENPKAPRADRGRRLSNQLNVVGTAGTAVPHYAWKTPTDIDRDIAERVLAHVSTGDRVQYAPGPLGAAVLSQLKVAVHIDSGILTDDVVELDQRGLLLGIPLGTYLAGTTVLYDWADGRPVLDGVECTHHPGRLAEGPPLIAINTALQVDLDGQVNVEGANHSALAGIGGQPDYAAAAATSVRGLSIIAVPTKRSGRSTLVERLDFPASTPSHDIDVLVTEHGSVDLRGLDRAHRRREIQALWR